MINGKMVDKVHYLTMLRSIQRMQELGHLTEWYLCDEGQLLTDFVDFSGVLPAPGNCIVSYEPIKDWSTSKPFQWFCKIRDEKKQRDVYFTFVSD